MEGKRDAKGTEIPQKVKNKTKKYWLQIFGKACVCMCVCGCVGWRMVEPARDCSFFTCQSFEPLVSHPKEPLDTGSRSATFGAYCVVLESLR